MCQRLSRSVAPYFHHSTPAKEASPHSQNFIAFLPDIGITTSATMAPAADVEFSSFADQHPSFRGFATSSRYEWMQPSANPMFPA
jgi:hypothetical protein